MNKEYTTKENVIYYVKRFLKVFVPTALVVIPTLGTSPEGFLVATLIPLLTTLDKFMREQNWYDY